MTFKFVFWSIRKKTIQPIKSPSCFEVVSFSDTDSFFTAV